MRLFDKSGTVKRTKVGYWTDEVYEIVSIYTPRKWANLSHSYKIKKRETGEIQHGLYSCGQLLPIPKETEMLRARAVNLPAVNENTVEEEDELESMIDSIVNHKIKGTRNRRQQVTYQIQFTGYRKLYWQLEEDLQGANRILQEYKRTHNIKFIVPDAGIYDQSSVKSLTSSSSLLTSTFTFLAAVSTLTSFLLFQVASAPNTFPSAFMPM